MQFLNSITLSIFLFSSAIVHTENTYYLDTNNLKHSLQSYTESIQKKLHSTHSTLILKLEKLTKWSKVKLKSININDISYHGALTIGLGASIYYYLKCTQTIHETEQETSIEKTQDSIETQKTAPIINKETILNNEDTTLIQPPYNEIYIINPFD